MQKKKVLYRLMQKAVPFISILNSKQHKLNGKQEGSDRLLAMILQHQKTISCADRKTYLYSYQQKIKYSKNRNIYIETFCEYKNDHKKTQLKIMNIAIDCFKSDDQNTFRIYKIENNIKRMQLAYSETQEAQELVKLDRIDLQIIDKLSYGYNNEGIAFELGYPKQHIISMRKQMLRKSGCRNTTELIYLALSNGLIH